MLKLYIIFYLCAVLELFFSYLDDDKMIIGQAHNSFRKVAIVDLLDYEEAVSKMNLLDYSDI